MQKPKYQIKVTEETKISISVGNIKIGTGIHAINLLPGDELLRNGTCGLLTDIHGTCTGVCDGCKNACYALRDAKRYHNTIIPSNGKNTLMWRKYPDLYFQQIKDYVLNPKNKVKVLRYHSSGEIENYDYLMRMVKLAKETPSVKYYFYTKRFDFIEKYLRENKKFPNNLVCNISVWHNNHLGYQLNGLNQFIYDDGDEPEVAKLKHCAAVSKPTKPGGKGKETGVTCDKCGLCWRKNKGHKIAVYNH